jgi:protein-tyrosine phosphatase
LATDSTDASTKEVLQFFTVLADASQLPVLVHCTQGKDRTGLTVLFTLMLLQIELGAAQYDYMLSQGELVSERADRLKEIHSIGLPDSFADCDPELVKTVDEHIRQRYGSIEGYLEHAGVDKKMQEGVRNNLLNSSSTGT